MHFVPGFLPLLIALATATGVAACSSDLGLPSEADDGGSTTSGGQPGGSSVEFEMSVVSADAAAGTLTLSNGTIVRVTAGTTVSPRGDLLTLESTDAAVEQGRPVRAEGHGSLESVSPSVIVANTLKIEVDD